MRNTTPPPGIGSNQYRENYGLRQLALGRSTIYQAYTGEAVQQYGGAGYSLYTADVPNPLVTARVRRLPLRQI